jgi:transposase InsO family protein
MNTQFRKAKAREFWIKTYNELGSVTKAARKCGIPRSTLYRWIERNKKGKSFNDKSKRPKRLAKQLITPTYEELILSIRDQYKFGQHRISTYLLRNHEIHLSPTTIWRVLSKHKIKPLKKYRKSNQYKLYTRPNPGDRVQLDVTKIANKCYQFTAVDDCTRMRVLRLYENKTAANSVNFLHEILDALPFNIARIQTDWGTEFFNDDFQYELLDHFIKFRPIKPRSPHLNGKVERSQQTDKQEFYFQFKPKERTIGNLIPKLKEWETFYNHQRPHASLKGKTPYERFLELENLVIDQNMIRTEFWNNPEEIRPRNYKYLQFIKNSKVSHMS